MNKQDIIEQLSLVKHIEGGYFKETYRSDLTINTDREGGERKLLTSIYYMLTDDCPINYFNKNKSDIIHYFHAGSPITYLTVDPEGKLSKFKLGFDVTQGHTPQLLVQGGCWKTAILEEGEFSLLGEAVAPGFEYIDMEMAKPDSFKASFPNLWDELSPYIKQ
ncbi:cupin domain-containing protein [Dapis sp. BLCC M172]|uniref:cupin domain-containing protein n=1 Tax=Dapis sp. BLCC M172 TaxID=2975281 RepID=UPI003CFA0AEF